MNHDIKISKENKDTLVALYRETWREIERLREYEWKITYYFTSLNAGMIAILFLPSFQEILTTWLRIFLTCFQVVSIILTVFYLEMTHHYLTMQRNIRRKIEDLFGFSEPGVFDEDAVLPKEWKDKKITRSYQRLGLLIPFMAMVICVELFCLMIIWKVPN